MSFRVRTVGEEGRFGSPLTIGEYNLTGEAQTFIGELDEELGFGVPPLELVEADGVDVETLGGQPWPGSWRDRNGKDRGRNAMLHAFRDGVWPDEAELVLQANVTAKLDPKSRQAVLKQHFLRQGLNDEQAEREAERRMRPGLGQKLLDGVKPIAPRKRPTRALPVATRSADGSSRSTRTTSTPATPPESQSAGGGSGDGSSTPPTPAAAQAKREAEAAAKAGGTRRGRNGA